MLAAAVASPLAEVVGFALSGLTDDRREVLRWNTGWLWAQADDPALLQASCDESQFGSVTLPHGNVFVLWDDNARYREYILRYAEIYNQISSSEAYVGGLGWCGFDYQTHADFGAGDPICYHGVMDIFRQPKPAAGFYRSQCSPQEDAVLEAGFHFAENDEPGGLKHAVICSNCEEIRCSIKPLLSDAPADAGWHHVIDLKPDHATYPHLEYPPFFLTLPDGNDDWGDLQMEGLVGGKVVVMKRLSGRGIDQGLVVAADDTELIADGMDTTRVTLTVTDQYGARRPLANDPVEIELAGPAVLLGTRLTALAGGTTAVWVRTTETPGKICLTVKHPVFGTRTVAVNSRPKSRRASAELVSFPVFTTTTFPSSLVPPHSSSPERSAAPRGA